MLISMTIKVKSDLPVHCLSSTIEGEWIFHLGDDKGNKYITCGHNMPDTNLDHINTNNERLTIVNTIEVYLERPNLVYDINKTQVLGRWTMIYDEGFEFNINEKLFFAFNKYRKRGTPSNKDNTDTPGYENLCGETFVGWYHNQKTNSHWGCYYGNKKNQENTITTTKSDSQSLHTVVQQSINEDLSDSPNNEIYFMELESEEDIRTFEPDYSFIEKINSNNNSLWKAKAHNEFIGKSYNYMRKLLGLSKFNLKQNENYFSSFLETKVVNTLNLKGNLRSKHLNKMKLKSKNKTKSKNRSSTKQFGTYNDALLENLLYSATDDSFNSNNENTLIAKKKEKSINGNRKIVDKSMFTSYSNVESPNNNILSNGNSKNEFGFPVNFDCRNIEGVNYDSPVRKQGECGSCYAIAAISVLESRIRIKTNNQHKPLLSVASSIACSRYNQGCDGGYPYLIGKHGREFGLVDESCQRYSEDDSVCVKECFNKKTYKVSDYGYVGDYYGGTNEEAMMKEVFNNGPIVVAINASSELYYYSGGIFTSNARRVEGSFEKEVKPWEFTNHAVTCVGWGEENVNGSTEKYWILKNSWGQNWGDKGYFKLKRGMASAEAQAIFLTPEI